MVVADVIVEAAGDAAGAMEAESDSESESESVAEYFQIGHTFINVLSLHFNCFSFDCSKLNNGS